MALLAEDLLLLLLHDETGREASRARMKVEPALAGAVLAELQLAGVITLGEPVGLLKSRKVLVDRSRGVADPVLREAAARIEHKERSADGTVRALKPGLRDALLDRLTAAGVLERQDQRVLRVFRRTGHPSLDARHEDALRVWLSAVLKGDQPADPRTRALLGLLRAIDEVHHVVPHPGLADRELKRRARDVAGGSWVASSVKNVVDGDAAAATSGVV